MKLLSACPGSSASPAEQTFQWDSRSLSRGNRGQMHHLGMMSLPCANVIFSVRAKEADETAGNVSTQHRGLGQGDLCSQLEEIPCLGSMTLPVRSQRAESCCCELEALRRCLAWPGLAFGAAFSLSSVAGLVKSFPHVLRGPGGAPHARRLHSYVQLKGCRTTLDLIHRFPAEV